MFDCLNSYAIIQTLVTHKENDMDTLRKQLTNLDFDFESGTIILHQQEPDESDKDDAEFCEYSKFDITSEWCEGIIHRNTIDLNHEVLDYKISCMCPCIIAKDKNAIYFPAQCDSRSWLEKVYIDIEKYLEKDSTTPYPGC